jgi:hypothetical protein
MSKQEKIIAAVAGAALLAGGKELYDRREAKQEGGDIHRNALHSVALAGVGALAAYQGAEFYNKQQAKKDQKAKLLLDGRYASDDEDDPREKKGNKSFIENALAATGLGAAVKSLTGGKDKDDDSKSRGGSPSRAGPAGGAANKVQKAAMASLLAGATEAFRVAKEPGGWKGEKTKRILTAAAGAASVDAAQGSDHGKLGMAESVIGGLVGTRLIRGSKNDIEEDKKTGRSRSRSRARSEGGGGTGLAALATAGLGALGAKKAYDHHRSKSRGRSDSRGSGSRSPSRRRSRSRSVVDKARDGLAKLGIGGGALALTNKDDDDRRRTQDDFDDRDRSRSRDRGSRRSRRYSDDYDDDYRPRRSDRDRDYYDEDDRRSTRGSRRDRSHGRGGRSEYAADSDLGDSSEDEKRAKKMRGKQIITTGLAAVATIHAAHNVYQSMEKRQARAKAVREGRLSEEEAQKLKRKAMLQDAASVGIAALGIKGAVDEMKEVKEISHERKEFHKEKAQRHAKREEHRQLLLRSRPEQMPEGWSAPASRSRERSRRQRGSEYDDDDGFYSDSRANGPRYFDGNPYRAATLPPPPPIRNPGER